MYNWRGVWHVVRLLPRVGDLHAAGLERSAFSEYNEMHDEIQDRVVDQEEMNQLYGRAKRRVLFDQNSTSGRIRNPHFNDIQGHELYSDMGYVSGLVPLRDEQDELPLEPTKKKRARKTLSFQTSELPRSSPSPLPAQDNVVLSDAVESFINSDPPRRPSKPGTIPVATNPTPQLPKPVVTTPAPPRPSSVRQPTLNTVKGYTSDFRKYLETKRKK